MLETILKDTKSCIYWNKKNNSFHNCHNLYYFEVKYEIRGSHKVEWETHKIEIF